MLPGTCYKVSSDLLGTLTAPPPEHDRQS